MLCSIGSAGLGLAVFAAGRSSLPLPRGWTLPQLVQWWSSTGWLVAVFVVARLLVLVATGVMASGSLVAAVAVIGRPGRRRHGWLGRAGRLPGGALLMRIALGMTASGLVAAACGPGSPPSPTESAGSSSSSAPEAAPILRNTTMPDPGPGRSPTSAGGVPVPPVASPAPASPAEPAGTSASPVAPPAAAPPGERTGSGAPAGGEWRVRPGDSLWSIAEANARSADQVSAYWVRLMALNRDRLPIPDDPSLLFPGDILLLPSLQRDG